MSDPYTPGLVHPPAPKSKIISDTATHTGKWVRAKVIGAANIASISMPGVVNASGHAGTGLADGYEISGTITSIALTSGKMKLDEV
jgi:hypothetical protein